MWRFLGFHFLHRFPLVQHQHHSRDLNPSCRHPRLVAWSRTSLRTFPCHENEQSTRLAFRSLGASWMVASTFRCLQSRLPEGRINVPPLAQFGANVVRSLPAGTDAQTNFSFYRRLRGREGSDKGDEEKSLENPSWNFYKKVRRLSHRCFRFSPHLPFRYIIIACAAYSPILSHHPNLPHPKLPWVFLHWYGSRPRWKGGPHRDPTSRH